MDLVWPGFAFRDSEIPGYYTPFQEEFIMEFTPIRPIEPLWTPAASQTGAQAQDPAQSLFASVFRSAIQNVRDTNAVQVDLEYQLATGQLDNPADLTLATSKATNAAILLMEMRNKAMDAYNELMRISL